MDRIIFLLSFITSIYIIFFNRTQTRLEGINGGQLENEKKLYAEIRMGHKRGQLLSGAMQKKK